MFILKLFLADLNSYTSYSSSSSSLSSVCRPSSLHKNKEINMTIKKVAVIGDGTMGMGSGIAEVADQHPT